MRRQPPVRPFARWALFALVAGSGASCGGLFGVDFDSARPSDGDGGVLDGDAAAVAPDGAPMSIGDAAPEADAVAPPPFDAGGCACAPPHATGSCVAGACTILRCDPGFGDCDGRVDDGCEVPLTSSHDHCGSCDHACASLEVCNASQCASACSPGLTACSGSCVDLTQDPAHCGSCTTPCPVDPNGQATCTNKKCGVSCNTGYHACSGTCLSSSSVHSCGMQCYDCQAPANATATCDGIMCGYACAQGYQPVSIGCATSSGWVAWKNGALAPVDLTDVWGNATSGVWTVGTAGVMFHNDGTSWQIVTTGAQDLYAIWGNPSGGAVYAVGHGGTVLFSTGDGAWISELGFFNYAFYDVWGSGPNDVYIVGQSGGILHGTGDGKWPSTAAQMSNVSSNLNGVWGSGAGDVYVVGDGGTILHSTGNGTWTAQTSGTTQQLVHVWGSGAGDVYAVGANGTIVHSTGNGTWTAQTSGTTVLLNGVWGSGAGDVYAVGASGTILHSTGNGAWAAETSGSTQTLDAVYGVGGAVYAVGTKETILTHP